MSHSYSVILRSILVLIISACSPANLAFAKDYKVEVLIFENLQEQIALESYQYQEIEDLSSSAELWPIAPSMLLDEVERLDVSEDYQLLYYYSWGQESLPVSESGAMNVLEAFMRGWVKIYAGHLLFINLDLDYNGYRLTEKRRIKLDEKHFFDHPKFGVLLQVSRLEPEEEDLDIIGEGKLTLEQETLITQEGDSIVEVEQLGADPDLLLPDPQIVENLLSPFEPEESTTELPQHSDLQQSK
ncbi:MAG: hypothetical protein ACI9LU_002710 [Polaribacter sp.]|jgi:hypothetical protein